MLRSLNLADNDKKYTLVKHVCVSTRAIMWYVIGNLANKLRKVYKAKLLYNVRIGVGKKGILFELYQEGRYVKFSIIDPVQD